MSIKDIFLKYFNNIFGKFEYIEADSNISIDPRYTNVLLNNLPDDPKTIFDILLKILMDRPHGGAIFINDTPKDFVNVVSSEFEVNNPDKYNGLTGMGIVYIIGIGYIITAFKSNGGVTYHEYTLEEYTKLSEEYIIVALAKQEEHYIKDWVDYHLRIGFDRIYLIDNNDENGEKYNDILKEYTQDNRLILISRRGEKSIQRDAYNSLYYTLPFKWCAIIDIDEFIWFNEGYKFQDIKSFISSLKDIRSYGIMLRWHCYKASGEDHPSDKPIWEANTELLDFNARKDCRPEYVHDWCKSIYKKGWQLEFNEHFAWPCHKESEYPVYEVSYENKPIDKEIICTNSFDSFIKEQVYVKHFLLRNINDFYYKKYLRGHAGLPDTGGTDGWQYWYWSQNMNYFTDITPVLTKEEQLFMIRRGMKVNYTFHPDVYINISLIPENFHYNDVISLILGSEVLPYTNSFLTCNWIRSLGNKYIKQEYSDEDQNMTHYEFDYLAKFKDNYSYFGIVTDDESQYIRQSIQEPIVMTIGTPLEFATEKLTEEHQKKYLDYMVHLFMWNNMKQNLRAIIEHGYTIIPKIGVEYIKSQYGWGDSLKEFLHTDNVPNLALTNNTYICSLSQYNKIKEYQKKFIKYYDVCSNEFIVDNDIDKISTPYHAYMASVMSVIEKPYYIWPN